jgi:glutaredoxin-related protein
LKHKVVDVQTDMTPAQHSAMGAALRHPTVPRVFVHARFVGGASELEAYLKGA